MSGFAFFIAAYLVGDFVSVHLGLPIPGAIVGMVLVLVMLIARGHVDPPLKQAADTFLRYLSLMLVPLGVGMVKILDDPARADVWKLGVVLLLALMLGAVLVAKIMQALLAIRMRKTISPPLRLGFADRAETRLDPVIADS
jgi:holin-like protein